MKKILLLLILVLILFSSTVKAQTHYCDTTPPSAGNGTVGVSSTVNVCAGPNDTNGNPVTITSWTLYDGAVGAPITMTKGTTSTVSGLTIYTGTYTPTTTGTHNLSITSTGNGKESVKSNPFVLTVVLPPAAPTTPVKLSLQ